MSDLPTIAEIAAKAKEIAAQRKPKENINTGTVYGGQHVDNSSYAGDYIAGNKSGKKSKKKK
ncbi:hypothetical protein [Streptomyces sp. NPDC059258]|uniref:hypothetical protein n=1 Tax=unclassified Streptomyces TaxID=2593676 RepID=UPI0036841D6F